MNPLLQLQDLGQSIWYDNIHRAMLRSGEMARMIREDRLRGVTSNPTIFEKAINGSKDYDAALGRLLRGHPDQSPRDLFFALAIEDIQQTADLFRPTYDETDGVDGMVSLEVSPDFAHDSGKTVAEARKLAQRVGRTNLMIKVPATAEGLPVIEALIAEGINVNVTLLFGVERYREVAEAYIRGLEAAVARGCPINRVASVASFFVSRVDTLVDKLLDQRAAAAVPAAREAIQSLRGKIAVANAKLAYRAYEELYTTARFAKLREHGARPQRLLWASTGTKNPDYRDVMYLEELIGPNTVNTVPPATYHAFKEHGEARMTLTEGYDTARRNVEQLHDLGIDLRAATQQLEDEGVESFVKSFKTLLAAIEGKTKIVAEVEALV